MSPGVRGGSGDAGADTGFLKGGGTVYDTLPEEARSADQSARSAENFFRLHFSLLRMGSRGTFALCTASSRCTRIAGPRAAMSFFLAYFAHERNTYVHGGVY